MRFSSVRLFFRKNVVFSRTKSRSICMKSERNQSTLGISHRETVTGGATVQLQRTTPFHSINRKIMSQSIEPYTVMRTKVEQDIMKFFRFPFYLEENFQPDGNTHEIPDATFRANGKFYVFYNALIFPGLTFRALSASAGDLNILTPEVKIEVEIPTIGGYFYTISGNPGEKSEITKGSFKLNYETVIGKGIFTFFIDQYCLYISDSVFDFEKSKHPRVIFYDDDGNEKTINDLSVDEKGSVVPDVMWPYVTSIIYQLFNNEMRNIAKRVMWHDISPNLPYHEAPLQSRASKVLNEIASRMNVKLKEIVKDGKIEMPDIETTMKDKRYENDWGKFSATSGWLGKFEELYITEHNPLVHMKNENELEFSGTIHIADELKQCYDKYSMKSTHHTAEGQIESILDCREIIVKITVKRVNGKSVKEGRVEFISGCKKFNGITGLDNFEWLEGHIYAWMSGELRAKGIPALKEKFEDCLNQVLEDFDVFAYWEAAKPETDGSEYYTRTPA